MALNVPIDWMALRMKSYCIINDKIKIAFNLVKQQLLFQSSRGLDFYSILKR